MSAALATPRALHHAPDSLFHAGERRAQGSDHHNLISRRPHAAEQQGVRSPHTAHPQPLREQAFTLHCQGLRSPAIANQLGVPQRTVRAWIAADLRELADDEHTLSRRQQLLLAVESQRAISAAAWQQFEQQTSADHTPPPSPRVSDSPRLRGGEGLGGRSPNLAPRYLTLAQHAQREIARLLGLYQLARLELVADPHPDTPASASAASHPPIAASPDPTCVYPAETATAPSSPVPPSASSTILGDRRIEPSIPAASATAATRAATASQNPAETATSLPPTAYSSVSSVNLRDLCVETSSPRPPLANSVNSAVQSPVPSAFSVVHSRPQKRQKRQPQFAIPRPRMRR